MEETLSKIIKDCEDMGHYRKVILECASKDLRHHNNPLGQIHTIASFVNQLLITNENGNNDELIGFYYHVCRSLKELIKYRTSNKGT